MCGDSGKRGWLTRLDGQPIFEPGNFNTPMPGMNRFTETELAPSDEALRYELNQRTKNRTEAMKNSGIPTQTLAIDDVMEWLKEEVNKIRDEE